MTNSYFYFPSSLKRFFSGFLLLEIVIRTILLAQAWSDIPHGALDITKMYTVGALFDTIVFIFLFSPFVLWKTFQQYPGKASRIFGQTLFFTLAIALFFKAFSEVLFWDEFQARFNFIAIDYLIYTHEVSQNVRESYNLPLLLSLIGFCGIGTPYLFYRLQKNEIAEISHQKISSRLLFFVLYLGTGFLGIKICEQTPPLFPSPMAQEISQNGLYTMAKAAIENGLEYERFYLTTKDLGASLPENLLAPTAPHQKRKPLNVILVLMESMSASFMHTFGNTENITPNLDRLFKESISFSNMYATGTRTVRGIEAVILSSPPLPGQSIVKRPNNENLQGLGWEFKNQGYVTQFIYGGYSYFDNMKHFFGENGFEIIDRSHFNSHEITFENAWGLCDEDLFDKVIHQATEAYAKKSPFMMIALTTSNHRPYTYPEGKIDLLPKISHRSGGVKYSDYAVGQLIEKAKSKEWFKDTIFVFVADHTAGTVGKIEIDPTKYHIPAILYCPHHFKPQVIKQAVSQIDLPTTLLSLIGIKSQGKYLGRDALHAKIERAFISNNQKVGYVEGDKVAILKPAKSQTTYHLDGKPLDQKDVNPLLKKAVSFYETASKWKELYKKSNVNQPPK